MPITYDITKDGLYLEGKEKGRKEGIKEGIKEGKQEGKQEGIEQVISKALSQNILTIEQIAEMTEVTIDHVLSVQSKQQKRN